VFLLFVYLIPDLHELMFGQPFTSMPRDALNTFIIFEGGTLICCYAVITAMVQRYSTVYLVNLRQFRLRRIILFVAAYSSLVGMIFTLQGYTGFSPAEGPVPPQADGAVQLFFLISFLAGLILSVRYYRFLGIKREAIRKG
jgi:hypothetical protein